MRIGRSTRPAGLRGGPVYSEQPILDALSEDIHPNNVSADTTDDLHRDGFPFRKA